jgi:hypothetical protein
MAWWLETVVCGCGKGDAGYGCGIGCTAATAATGRAWTTGVDGSRGVGAAVEKDTLYAPGAGGCSIVVEVPVRVGMFGSCCCCCW